MPNPTQRDVHIDRALSDISVAYKNPEYFAKELAPVVPVNHDTDTFFIYDKSNLKQHDLSWTPGTRAYQVEWNVKAAPSYVCRERANEQQIIWKYRDNADDPIKYEQDTTENGQDLNDLDNELNGVSFFQNVANYGNGAGLGVAGSNVDQPTIPWNATGAVGSATYATPLQDVFSIRKIIHRGAIVYPNIMAVTDNIFDVLCVNPQITELMKYTQGGTVPEDILARLFRVDKFIVLSTEYDSAAEGATQNMASTWSDVVLMLYANPSPGIRKPSFAYTFQRKGYPYVKRWVEDVIDCDWLRIADSYSRYSVDSYCGFMLQNVLR